MHGGLVIPFEPVCAGMQIGWTALLSMTSSQGPVQPTEVVIAGPGPVVNVLEEFDDPVTASLTFLEQNAPPVELGPLPEPSLRRKAVRSIKQVASFAKFW